MWHFNMDIMHMFNLIFLPKRFLFIFGAFCLFVSFQDYKNNSGSVFMKLSESEADPRHRRYSHRNTSKRPEFTGLETNKETELLMQETFRCTLYFWVLFKCIILFILYMLLWFDCLFYTYVCLFLTCMLCDFTVFLLSLSCNQWDETHLWRLTRSGMTLLARLSLFGWCL